jgi:hypothetical protein
LNDVWIHRGLTLVNHGLDIRMLEQDLEIIDLEAVFKDECTSIQIPEDLLSTTV